MKINNINSQINFGRVIPVKTTFIQNNNAITDGQKEDKAVIDVVKVLNGSGSDLYTKEQSDTIRMFFKNILGDYNGQNGIMLRRVQNQMVILSGKDAEAIKNMEKFRTSDSGKKQHGRKVSKKNRFTKVQMEVDNEIKKRLENGKQLKDESLIEFKSSNPILSAGKSAEKVKFSSIVYSRLSNYFTLQNDGVRSEMVVKKVLPENSNNRLQNYNYEKQELIIDSNIL